MVLHTRVASIPLLGILLTPFFGISGQADPLEETYWIDGAQSYDVTSSFGETTDNPIETADFFREPTASHPFRLPRPLQLSRSFSNGAWRVDGVGVRPAPDVEIRATGRINSRTERMQGDLSLRFLF